MRNVLILMFLTSGLIFTSIIKNKTRLLEKELLYLDKEVNILNSSLDEATLDFEYLSTPHNISLLVKNYFDENFVHYRKSQIVGLGETHIEEEKIPKIDRKISKLPTQQKTIDSKILTKKNTSHKLIEKRIAIKESFEVEKTADDKKTQNTKKKIQRWAGLQVIKVMFGIPIVPGSN